MNNYFILKTNTKGFTPNISLYKPELMFSLKSLIKRIFFLFLFNTLGLQYIQAQSTDSDGDGIADTIDLDDDNDGILDIVECPISNNFELNPFTGTPTVVTGTVNGVGYTVNMVATPPSSISAFQVSTGPLAINSSVFNNTSANFSSSNYTPTSPTSDGLTFIPNGNIGAVVGTVTFTFASPVLNPVFHFQNIDFSTWDASATTGVVAANLTKLSGNSSLQVIGTIISDNNASTFDANFQPTLAGQINSAYGSVRISGIYSTISFMVRISTTSPSAGTDGIMMKITTDEVCDTDGDGIPNNLDLDSDNDGCLDAIEGGASILTSQLVSSGGTVTVGTGSSAANQNLCASSSCVNANGLPQLAAPADYSNTTGQSIGTSQNAAVNTCFCYKPAQTTGTTLDTNHGITALGRAGADNDNWPMVRKSAWTVLEAKTKGFAVNRLTDSQVTSIPAANLKIGMMVYNITQDCLQINVDGTATGWKCFNTQTCPD